MKSLSKILLVGAVAVSAIAISGVSAEAAKKKGKAQGLHARNALHGGLHGRSVRRQRLRRRRQAVPGDVHAVLLDAGLPGQVLTGQR